MHGRYSVARGLCVCVRSAFVYITESMAVNWNLETACKLTRSTERTLKFKLTSDFRLIKTKELSEAVGEKGRRRKFRYERKPIGCLIHPEWKNVKQNYTYPYASRFYIKMN